MGGKRNRICRLCLEAAGTNFEVIGDITKEIFDVLLLNVDLSISDEPVMCENCTASIRRCFEFKSSCMLAQDCIFPFTSNKIDASVDLRKVYFSVNKDEIPEGYNICLFCIQHVRKKRCTSLDTMKETKVFVEKMLAKCFPEMNLRVIKEPVICANCMDALDAYFSFMAKCWDIEDKIDEYIKTVGIPGKVRVQLNVVQVSIRNMLQSDSKHNHVNVIKMEKGFLENRENEEVEVNEAIIKLDQQDAIIKDEEIKINIKENSSDSVDVEEHSPQATTESEFRHATGMMYKCELCEFHAKYKISLNKHMQLHEEDFGENKVQIHSPKLSKRSALKFQARCKDDVETPALFYKQRKNHSEAIFRCDKCSFQAKRKSYLWKHKQMHKNPSEITMYKCKECSHQTRHKGNLRKHMMIHKEPSESTMYKCAMCVYQSRQKGGLKEHMLMHRPSEIIMHKCKKCSYQTRLKYSLKKHMVLHMKPSEITMYKCSVCTYQSRWKYSFNIHLLLHKDPYELTSYKCEVCSYQTRYKNHFNSHKQLHMEPSEVAMYKCASCTYQTRYKQNLKDHILLHKDSSEIKMYKCELCSYQAKQQYCVKRHMRVHKEPSEITMYKCAMCTFQSKYKNSLRNHIKSHQK